MRQVRDNAEALAAYKARITNAKAVDNQLAHSQYDKNYRRDRYEADVARAAAYAENQEYTAKGIAKDFWNASGGALYNLGKSMFETFTGQNAVGKKGYLNFGQGGPSWPHRVGGVATDALNIASAIPAIGYAKGAIAGVDAAKAGFAEANALEQSLNTDLQSIRANYAQQLALNDAQIGEKVFPSASLIHPEEWAVKDPGMMRVFHTNMKGEPLPYPLSPIEEVSGTAHVGRRGSGGDQLISHGLYTTDSGAISSTYGGGANQSLSDITHSYVPPSLSDINGARVRISPGSNPISLASHDVQNMWKQSLLENPHTLDTKISELITPNTYSNMGQIFSHPFGQQGNWISRAIESFKPETAKYVEAFTSDLNNNTKTIFDLINNAPNEDIAKDITRNWPHSLAYRPQEPGTVKFNWNVVGKAGETKSVNTAAADFENPYFLNIKNANARIRSFKPTFDMEKTLLAKAKAFDEQMAAQRGMSLLDYYEAGDTEMNPYNWGGGMGYIEPQGVTNVPQSYWDLPVNRSAEGALSIGDQFKSFDFAHPTEENIKDFVSLYRQNFQSLTGKPFGANSAIDSYLTGLEYPPKSLSGEQLNEYNQRVLIKLGGLLNEGVSTSGITPKEKFYEMLKQLGYNAIPHEGGLTTGGVRHQAVNFLRPESLPPSKFIPGGRDYIADLLGQRYGILSSQASEYGTVKNAGIGPINAAKDLAHKQAQNVINNIRRLENIAGGRLATQPVINTMNR